MQLCGTCPALFVGEPLRVPCAEFFETDRGNRSLTVRVLQLPPVLQIVAGAQGVGVVGSQDTLAVVEQGGELFDCFINLPRPA